MRTVWVVKQTDLDISGAELFGELNTIYGRDTSPIDLKKQMDIIRQDVLPHSSPNDLLMTVGPTAMVSLLSALWLEYHGSIQFLIYSQRKKAYTHISVNTN